VDTLILRERRLEKSDLATGGGICPISDLGGLRLEGVTLLRIPAGRERRSRTLTSGEVSIG